MLFLNMYCSIMKSFQLPRTVRVKKFHGH